jgi:heterodisulfide reductase subunit B
MKYAFYLGCVMPHRYPAIEKSIYIVFDALDVELLDFKRASCCPAPGVFGSFDHKTWLAIAARNLVIAEEMGVDIITGCNGCFASLFEANYFLKENTKLREEVNQILAKIGKKFKGTTKVRHLVDVLHHDIGLEKIKKIISKPLEGLYAAAHYGCHYSKPSRIKKTDNPNNPHTLDDLINATGTRSIDYLDKQMCCGAGGGVRSAELDVSLEFTHVKLKNIAKAGANCIVDMCPFCHLQFDLGQVEIEKKFGKKYTIPVIYITQLIGLSMGKSLDEVGIPTHLQYILRKTRPTLEVIK